MKRAEKESLLKSFFIFFISLTFLATILTFLAYSKQKQDLSTEILTQMKLCSFDLQCGEFEFDFIPKDTQSLYELSSNKDGYYSLFPLPQDSQYVLKLTVSMKSYEDQLFLIQQRVGLYYCGALVVIGVLSLIFSLYTLYPLKEALRLTQEFSRDMVHDLHTPLSALKLNLERLQGLPQEERKIERMKQSVEAIVSLGENLKSYLEGHPLQVSTIDLYHLLVQRVDMLQKIYPSIDFEISSFECVVHANYDAFVRVVDNLLTNAAKYNHPSGSVAVSYDQKTQSLKISDTGKGMKFPERAFERFYKEHERGLGIGLHIVKKLCDEMKINVALESEINKGTIVTLDISRVKIA